MSGVIPLQTYRAVKKQVIKDMLLVHADDSATKKAVRKAFRLLRADHSAFYAIKMATREHVFDFLNMPTGPGAAS